MDFLEGLSQGNSVINYTSRGKLTCNLKSITANDTLGDSLYAIVDQQPPQRWVTYFPVNDGSTYGGYYYRVVSSHRVWLSVNPEIAGYRVELEKDKVETFLNEASGIFQLRQPGDLTPASLGLPPASETEDVTGFELSDPALASTDGVIGLRNETQAVDNKTSIKVLYSNNYDATGTGDGQTVNNLDNTANIAASFLAICKSAKRKLSDAKVELGFDSLSLPMISATYNPSIDFFSKGGIRSAALKRYGKTVIILGNSTAEVQGPEQMALSDVEGVNDNYKTVYYTNNFGHIQGVRYYGRYFSIPTVSLSTPVSAYLNHVLELEAQASLDPSTFMVAALGGLDGIVQTISGSITKPEVISAGLNGALGQLIPPEYTSTLGFAIAYKLGLQEVVSAYQKKLALDGVSNGVVDSNVASVYYQFQDASAFLSIPNLSSFTCTLSQLLKPITVDSDNVHRKRAADPIDVVFAGPKDALDEGINFISSGFYLRSAN